MTNSKKIFLIFVFWLFLNFILTGFSSAQIEINYPPIQGISITTQTILPGYIEYIFNFSLMIAGFVAFAVLVLGGFRYLTSTGDPTKMADARDQVLAGFLGLIILLSSYLILVTINPQLVTLKAPGLEAFQGVILYKGDCQATKTPEGDVGIDFLKFSISVSNIKPLLKEEGDSFVAKSIYFIDSPERLEVKLYQETGYRTLVFDSPRYSISNNCYNFYDEQKFQSIKLTWKNPGVYLFTGRNYGGTMFPLEVTTDRLPEEIEENVYSIKFIDNKSTDTIYDFGAILHELRDRTGIAAVFLESCPDFRPPPPDPPPPDPPDPHPDLVKCPRYYSDQLIGVKADEMTIELDVSKVTSATYFKPTEDKEPENDKITLCRNKGCSDGEPIFEFNFNQILTTPIKVATETISGYESKIIKGISDLTKYKWDSGKQIDCGRNPLCWPGVSGILIEGTNYLVVLFDQTNYKGNAEVITKNKVEIDLNDNVWSVMIIKIQIKK